MSRPRDPADPPDPADPVVRRTAWCVLGAGVTAFVLLAILLVPWHPYPGGRLTLPAASSIFTHDELARATEYSHVARWLARGSLVVSLLAAALLGFTGLGRRLDRRLPGPWPVRTVLAALLVVLVGRLVTAPFAVALQRHDRSDGLSRQSWASWTQDQLVSTGIYLVAASLALVALSCCTRWAPRRWPLVAGALLAVLVVLGSFVYPVLVQPLFNDFTSLPDGRLRDQVMALARQEGVTIDDVLVADASKQTTAINAYVTGFGSTRRIVLYDTLVDSLPRAETLAVVSHELAHAKHEDVATGTVLGAAGALVAVGLVGVLAGRRYDGLRSPAAVPLLLALFAFGSALATPVENVLSRQIETRADVDGVRTTGDLDAFIALQRELDVRSLTDPTPPALSQWWFGSHPTSLQRIAIGERVLADSDGS
ncbi:MAG: M48 family metallopeptidase [Nocardioides sp.]|uniref:M48 family metallopeptidase n=1 Tax=Nocardioides sp. TaxID=35761 RepID=UPI0039E6B297